MTVSLSPASSAMLVGLKSMGWFNIIVRTETVDLPEGGPA